jgi:hypothetical protein
LGAAGAILPRFLFLEAADIEGVRARAAAGLGDAFALDGGRAVIAVMAMTSCRSPRCDDAGALVLLLMIRGCWPNMTVSAFGFAQIACVLAISRAQRKPRSS